MTALLKIRSHVRRWPIDPLAEIRAAKTAQLEREVEQRISCELVQALEDELARDPAFSLTAGLVL